MSVMSPVGVKYENETELPVKTKRASVACNLCRDSKLKCINNNDKTQCERCTLLKLECSYTLKKSQLKKRKLSKHFKDLPVDTSNGSSNRYRNSNIITKSPTRAPGLNIKAPILTVSSSKESSNSINDSPHSPPIAKPALKPYHSIILPVKSIILEVAEIYFENQYKGIFPHLHKPSIISFIRSPEFDPKTYITDYYNDCFDTCYTASLKYPDPVILLAILALCSRLHPDMPKMYGNFSEDKSPETFVPNLNNINNPKTVDNDNGNAASNASNYFGWHARNILKEVFDSPTIQRVQALTILSSHEWGEGCASRSFLYVGIAARMVLLLGLGNESGLFIKEEEDKNLDEASKFICIEGKRRTMWAVYMMDRCNSSGRDRHSCIKLNDIKLKLPSTEKDFIFRNYKQKSLTFEEANNYIHDPTKRHLLSDTSCFGFLIILFETWASIAKWAGETGGKLEKLPPWEKESPYYKLSKELDTFRDSLPIHLQFNHFNLEAHIADGSAADFGYFHGLFFLCRIFLNREYFFCTPESFPEGWWETETRVLLETLDDLSYITRTLKPINMMVIAPFTGFQVFTVAATSFYFDAFPKKLLISNFPFKKPKSEEALIIEVEQLKNKYRNLAAEALDNLATWRKVWGLGNGWYTTSLKLQKMFAMVAKENSSAVEDDDLRHSMHDYGIGKVQEEFKPEYVRDRKDMNISSLLVSDENKEPRTANFRATPSPFVHESLRELASPAGLNSPSLDFINNFDLSNIFPGWNDPTKM
ncbi:uncharacterized protein RJT21DRAFT_141690 [Scheffersomyces amazonensis]|uniref:uncharacterized protein n=1 Tax=Scheffersomyces amazonensis TaxID=1078765 RepID=UPI00315D81EF